MEHNEKTKIRLGLLPRIATLVPRNRPGWSRSASPHFRSDAMKRVSPFGRTSGDLLGMRKRSDQIRILEVTVHGHIQLIR